MMEYDELELEKLGVGHSNQKIHAILGIAHYEEQGCLAISEGVQFQLVVGSDLPKLRDVEHGKARTAGNHDALGCFARNELSRTF